MKAVILVGGMGTRLQPLTINTPKAMMPVLNKPFLEHVIRHLARHNIKDIILSQGYLAQSIEDHFGDGHQLGVRLAYNLEETPLGTAGAVKHAERYLDDTFLALNGDVFTDLDITAMVRLHQERKATVTIALTPVEDPTHYGLIETDNSNRVLRFLEKPGWDQVTTNMINAGTYVLEPEILNNIPEQTNFSFEHQVFPGLLKQCEPVYAYPSSAYWLDIGSPQKYFQLNKDILGGKCSECGFARGNEVIIGRDCQIQPTAEIKGPAVIGDGVNIGRNVRITGPAAIGPGCHIEDGAEITQAVIWQTVKIGKGSRVINSIVANHCRLGAESVIEDSVLSDNVTVARCCWLKPGSQVQPKTSLS